MPMRSTPDLIAELEDEARNHWYVAMVVGFENSTIFVQAKDENRLAMLNSAIQVGAIPVGLIAADKTGNELTLQARCFSEHQDSEEFDAEGYLLALTNQVRETLMSRG
jgi:homoaconitase/3-isopropylmalate dehydratase large subunit